MFKIIIELDEKRMEKDGLNIDAAWAYINKMIVQCKKLNQIEKGIVVTDSFGMRGWFMELLEETPWFMKYVCRWESIGPNYHDDVIKIYNRIGKRCSYV